MVASVNYQAIYDAFERYDPVLEIDWATLCFQTLLERIGVGQKYVDVQRAEKADALEYFSDGTWIVAKAHTTLVD